MRKHESNRGSKVESPANFTAKKKSLAQQIPALFTRVLSHSTPKSPLQFRSSNTLAPLTTKPLNETPSRVEPKDIKTTEKVEKRDKENQTKGRKLAKRDNK